MTRYDHWERLQANPLKKARVEIGDHRTVADMLGISWRTIYRYEKGDSEVPKWYPLALSALKQKAGRKR